MRSRARRRLWMQGRVFSLISPSARDFDTPDVLPKPCQGRLTAGRYALRRPLS